MKCRIQPSLKNGVLTSYLCRVPGINEQIDFYNRYWEKLEPLSTYKVERMREILKELLQVRYGYSNPRLLDYGCGDGRMTALWDMVVGEAYGIDLSSEAIEKAKSMYPAMANRFVSGDAHKTTFPDGHFQLVIHQEVLEHTFQQAEMLAEVNRLMQPGGTLIITTPNQRYFDATHAGNYSRQPIENTITPEALNRLLVEAGFEVKCCRTFLFGYIDKGWIQILNHGLLYAVLRRLGLNPDHWVWRLGYGVNTLAVAVKK